MFRPLAAALVAALGVVAFCEDASACFRRRHQQFCAPYATTGPYVVGAQPRTRPSISYLDPASVEPGWEGVLRIHGGGFDKDSFALIDGNVPKMTYKSDTLLEADVKKDITAKEGKKIVKVHTGGGDLSNEAYWYVRKKASQGTGGKAKKAQVLKLCADFTLFPDNHVLGPKFALAGFAFTQLGGKPPLFVNVSGGGKGLQFPKQGMKVELPASVPVVELDLGTFAGPVKIEAFDAAGKVVQTQPVPGTNKFQKLKIAAPSPHTIASLVFTEGGGEGNLSTICIELRLAP